MKPAVVGVFAFLAVSCCAGAQDLLLKNARVLTVRNGVLERGDILIRGGRIDQVGTVRSAPGARVIDLTGKTVMPGIVDANAKYGITGNEQASEVTSRARSLHMHEPDGVATKRALLSGVTSACITPGSANVIGGICSAVRTSGENRNARVLRDSVAVRAALGADVYSGNSSFRGGGAGLTNIYNRRPNSRMGTVWELRKALYEADKHPALARALSGSLPIRIHARTENDIRVVLGLMDEFKLRHVILDDAVEAHRVADQLAARGVRVVLGPFSDPQSFSPEGADVLLNTAGLLASKGVRLALGSNGAEPDQLRIWAALAARSGLTKDLALRAITLGAAEASGISDIVGSVERGKHADLLILDGDPLQITSKIELIVSRGRVAFDAR